jgi:hypothetical protein
MGGGGNDPSCGCDMQAGWPPASEFPRGGIQGGGNWNFNEFNLALTKNGKTKHLRGKWNTNGMMSPSMNTSNSNMNNKKNTNNGKKNNRKTLKSNTNRKTNNKKTNKTNKNKNKNRRITSPPPQLENLMYEGKLYQTNRSSGDTFENGEYVGKYIRPNSGRPYLDRNMEQSAPMTPNSGPITPPSTPLTPNYAPPNSAPQTLNGEPPSMEENSNEEGSEEYDTEEMNTNTKTSKTLSMNGGGMPACGSCPFPGTGYCDFYAKGGQRGGGCGCGAGLFKGGYRPTKKNLKYLKKWKRGESIGFTMTASLKAKGLIPRTSRKQKGKRVVSRKYR